MILLTCTVTAQDHSIKGRIIGYIVPPFYTLGRGYEYEFKSGLSAQILYSQYTLDHSITDGEKVGTKLLAIESRYYLGKGEKAQRTTRGFVSANLERRIEAREQPLRNGQSITEERTSLGLGGLLGLRIRMNSQWYFEFYFGRTNLWGKNEGEDENGIRDEGEFNNSCFRGGFNFGYWLGEQKR